MNSTLTSAPLVPLLERLFEQAEQATSPEDVELSIRMN
jgi:hypothetical protein